MKKALLIILILAVLIAGAVSLSACSSASPIPGIAWASSETLVYDIKDNDVSVGTLTVTAVKLEPGNYKIERFGDRTFTVAKNSANGTRVTKVALDNDGNEMMYSESILSGFSSLASYKKVNYAGNAYEYRVFHEGKYFYYNTDGGTGFNKIKAKSGYSDNELLYYTVRCYDLGDSYSSTYSVLSPGSDSLEKIAVATQITTVPYAINYTDADGVPQAVSKDCISVKFSKSESPTGTSIYVLYSPADFLLKGNVNTLFNESVFIPVQIEENNMVYTLTSAVAA